MPHARGCATCCARLRKRSLHTVRNLVARLFELFEVQSREQLAVECVRRGLYSPG